VGIREQVGSSSRGSWTDKNSSVHPQLPDGLLEAARGGRRTGRAGDMWSYSLRDAIRPILEAAKRAGGSAWEAARYVINRMGERGLGDYGDLLRN
jgi:hypothetical protein